MPPPKKKLPLKKVDEAIHQAVLSAQKARDLLYKADHTRNPEQINLARQQWQIALHQLKHVQKRYHLYMNIQQRIDLKLVHEMLEHHGYQVLA